MFHTGILYVQLTTYENTNTTIITHAFRVCFCACHIFVPGFMKSGTTTLYNALIQHPDIVATVSKEPQWWYRLPLSSEYYIQPMMKQHITSYFRFLFTASRIIFTSPSSITLDASADTINRSPYVINSQDYCTLPALISNVLPNAKFVILMRNPVTRTYSHFLYACTQHFTWNTTRWPEMIGKHPADHFHQQVIFSINNFTECLQQFSLFECTNMWRFQSRFIEPCGAVGFRLTTSIYYSYIAKWLQFFPKEQFLFLRTEDINSKSYEFITSITEFLDLSTVSPPQAHTWLSSSRNQQRFQYKSDLFRMRDDTRRLLEDFYHPYNVLLSELIGGEHAISLE